jgi:hypothetical protein
MTNQLHCEDGRIYTLPDDISPDTIERLRRAGADWSISRIDDQMWCAEYRTAGRSRFIVADLATLAAAITEGNDS